MIENWNLDRDGPLSEAAMRRKLETRGYRVTRYVYPPGTAFPAHAHADDKIDGILAGRFEMIVEGERMVLNSGDCLAVPKGIVHSARVLGHDSVVSLDAVKIG